MSPFDLPEMRRIHWAQALPIEQAALVATIEILELNSWFEDDVHCEAQLHPEGSYGHVPAEHAAYLVKFTCCGATRKMCASWVHASSDYEGVVCFACGGSVLPDELVKVPI